MLEFNFKGKIRFLNITVYIRIEGKVNSDSILAACEKIILYGMHFDFSRWTNVDVQSGLCWNLKAK